MIRWLWNALVWCLFGNPVGLVLTGVFVLAFVGTFVWDWWFGSPSWGPRADDGRQRLFTYEQRMEIIGRDGASCAYCGATGVLETDHVVPYSKGGPTEVFNGQMLCGEGHGCEANWWKSAARDDDARAEFLARFGVPPVTGMFPPGRVVDLWERVYGSFPG